MSAPHSVSIIAFPGVQPLDVVGPHEVFAGANQVLGRAEYHFTRVFTEHVGHSPGRYVDQIRIEQARQRLERTRPLRQ